MLLGASIPPLSPTDSGFGARLLELCNQGLFECLALNLHCLGGQQMELAAVINGRIVSAAPAQVLTLCPSVSCGFHSLLNPTCCAGAGRAQKLLESLIASLLPAPSAVCLVG